VTQAPTTTRAAYVTETGPAESIMIGTLPVPRPAATMINRLLVDGALDVHVHPILPLDRAAEAHRMIENGVSGKVLLRVGSTD
jgi:NADPH:quinone reductase-like Zn-dependent oxidoreductase